ncbi:MAG: beta-lactamase family protein [Candidatus Eremiobacteraeota bacterium]|nr:beta-lactamase family protein [Candidatus Eremiobacteraeota bacterium]MBV9055906.1 beta-lactamase family protein [Candidatus Eremiobacteraeota bacterium]
MRLAAFPIAAFALFVACASPVQRGSLLIPRAYDDNGMPVRSPIAITGIGNDTELDHLVVRFMVSQRVPNAQLAVSVKGATTFSHAYTYRGLAASMTARSTIMRLASNTKAWTSGALYNLIEARKLDPNAKVFQYLGITKPLPRGAKVDKRVYQITIEDMILHESGWDDSKPPYYDPTFHMRDIALALHLQHEVDPVSYVRYQLHEPLQEAPGTTYAYCNFCYTVLGMVVAKASGESYTDYVAHSVAAPMGVKNVEGSPTMGERLPHEVAAYYSAYKGLSAVYVLSKRRFGYPYGGDDMALEVAGGAAQLATTADSMLAFMQRYLIWGVGTPQPGADWAREGSMPGTNTWAEQLPNGTNYAFLVNTRQYVYGKDPHAFENLQRSFEGVLQQRR